MDGSGSALRGSGTMCNVGKKNMQKICFYHTAEIITLRKKMGFTTACEDLSSMAVGDLASVFISIASFGTLEYADVPSGIRSDRPLLYRARSSDAWRAHSGG